MHPLLRPHAALLVVAMTATARAQAPAPPPPIADNSFLLEEAYNQEARVVQHINVFQRALDTRAWGYAFVQEWPLGGQRHQGSVTVPLARLAGTRDGTGLGDVALNYRYQLGGPERRAAAAPRLSLLLPTGDERKGLGSGVLGVQANFPVSVLLSDALVTHWNAGATLVPRARSALGEKATTWGVNLGGSAIWHARPMLNLLVEVAWTRAESVVGPDVTEASTVWFVSPGVRWAHNFRNGLQIVPGVGFPIGLGPSAGEETVVLYLSFEHPF